MRTCCNARKVNIIMASAQPKLSWRVNDVVTAAVLAVACGVIFLIWNYTGGGGIRSALDALLPGTKGLLTGTWFIGGIIVGLVIRKPGAALFGEVLASVVEMAMGSSWGMGAVYSGIAQGLGAEIVFALFMYRQYNLLVAALAGVGAAVGKFILAGVIQGGFAKGLVYQLIYGGTMAVSGALLAGVLGYILVMALAKTGALDRFAVGREVRARV